MIAYLSEHFRYYTMNSWNLSTSYAARVKVDTFVPRDLLSKAYDFLGIDEAFHDGNDIIREFDERWNHEWQIGSNGRSGGYLVLYHGGQKPSGYKRHCHFCGQQNYRRGIPQTVLDDKSPEGVAYLYALTHTMWIPEVYPTQSEIAELDLPVEKVIEIAKRAKEDVNKNGEVGVNQCGHCHREGGMQDYKKTHMRTFTMPGKEMDEDPNDFDSWDTDSLRDRVRIVWDFDKTIQKVLDAFIDFVKNHRVEEKEIMIPKTVKVAVEE